MEIPKFEQIVKNRIENDRKIAEDKAEREKKTISFLYKQIIKELADEFRNRIESYNKVLTINNITKQIFLYFDEYYYENLEKTAGNKIVILFNENSAKIPKYGTPVSNYSNFTIYFERLNGLKEQVIFITEYLIHTRHAAREKETLRFEINETKKDYIIKEINAFFERFIEAYFEKSDK